MFASRPAPAMLFRKPQVHLDPFSMLGSAGLSFANTAAPANGPFLIPPNLANDPNPFGTAPALANDPFPTVSVEPAMPNSSVFPFGQTGGGGNPMSAFLLYEPAYSPMPPLALRPETNSDSLPDPFAPRQTILAGPRNSFQSRAPSSRPSSSSRPPSSSSAPPSCPTFIAHSHSSANMLKKPSHPIQPVVPKDPFQALSKAPATNDPFQPAASSRAVHNPLAISKGRHVLSNVPFKAPVSHSAPDDPYQAPPNQPVSKDQLPASAAPAQSRDANLSRDTLQRKALSLKDVPDDLLLKKEEMSERKRLQKSLQKESEAQNTKKGFGLSKQLAKQWRKQKKVNIEDVVAPVGICQEMCSETEIQDRIIHNAFDSLEKTSGEPDPLKAVKKYSQSSAGDTQKIPSELRPPVVLLRTMEHLKGICDSGADYKHIYDFVLDRARALHQDIACQHIRDDIAIKIIEECCRFLIHSAHRLCELPEEQFMPTQNLEHIDNCLVTLRTMYNHRRECGMPTSPNEPEMQAYFLLVHMSESLKCMNFYSLFAPDVKRSEPVQFAFKVCKAASDLPQNPGSFFISVRRAPYLAACIMHMRFTHFRICALQLMNETHGDSDDEDNISISFLTSRFCFEDDDETSRFCGFLGFQVVETMDTDDVDGSKEVLVHICTPCPMVKSGKVNWKPCRALTIIESKCGALKLSEVFSGEGGVTWGIQKLDKSRGVEVGPKDPKTFYPRKVSQKALTRFLAGGTPPKSATASPSMREQPASTSAVPVSVVAADNQEAKLASALNPIMTGVSKTPSSFKKVEDGTKDPKSFYPRSVSRKTLSRFLVGGAPPKSVREPPSMHEKPASTTRVPVAVGKVDEPKELKKVQFSDPPSSPSVARTAPKIAIPIGSHTSLVLEKKAEMQVENSSSAPGPLSITPDVSAIAPFAMFAQRSPVMVRSGTSPAKQKIQRRFVKADRMRIGVLLPRNRSDLKRQLSVAIGDGRTSGNGGVDRKEKKRRIACEGQFLPRGSVHSGGNFRMVTGTKRRRTSSLNDALVKEGKACAGVMNATMEEMQARAAKRMCLSR